MNAVLPLVMLVLGIAIGSLACTAVAGRRRAQAATTADEAGPPTSEQPAAPAESPAPAPHHPPPPLPPATGAGEAIPDPVAPPVPATTALTAAPILAPAALADDQVLAEARATAFPVAPPPPAARPRPVTTAPHPAPAADGVVRPNGVIDTGRPPVPGPSLPGPPVPGPPLDRGPGQPAAPLAAPTGQVSRPRTLWAPPHADLAAEVAKMPRRRRRDDVPGEPDRAPATPLRPEELPAGFTDPITGLPLADAMRADIELRATDFRTYTVVVCHPMMAMTTPGGMVNASPNASFGEEELRIFAGVLRDTLRQRDTVGRYDERLFLLFLPRCKVDEVRVVMDRIRANLLLAQLDQPSWVDITFGAAHGQIGESVDGPLKVAYADLLQRNAGPAWFLQP